MKPHINDRLATEGVLILDGATGTELERRGVPMDSVLWATLAMETHPHVVRGIHDDYVRAGADVLTASTYGAVRHALEPAGYGGLVRKLNEDAVAVARAAADAVAGERPVWIAGSISSFITLSDHRQMPSRNKARDGFREQADILAESGVDIILLEMLRDDDLSVAATEAAVATGLPVWLGFTCKVVGTGEDQQVMLKGRVMETPLVDSLKSLLAIGGSLVAIMHTYVNDIAPALKEVRDHWKGPTGVYPNAGFFEPPHWNFTDVISPDAFSVEAEHWIQQGVKVIGGCCGLGPKHIERIASKTAR